MKFLVCLFFPLLLFALGVKDFHISSDSKKIEIIFLLDSVFNSSVSKEYADTFGAIVLKNVDFDEQKIIEHTTLVRRIEIFKSDNDLYIVFAQNDFDVKYSIEVLSSNRILKIIVTKNDDIATELITAPMVEEFPLKQANDYTLDENQQSLPVIDLWIYIVAISLLFVLLFILIIIKNKNKHKMPNFKDIDDSKDLINIADDISISRVIGIDLKNKIIILDSKDYKYLLFVGEHDSFIIDRIKNNEFNEDDINSLLKNKEIKLPFLAKEYKNEKY